MLSGISSKNEMASITPAAKDSILNMNLSEGFLNTPINDPISGPAMLIKIIVIIGCISVILLFGYLNVCLNLI